MAEGLLRARGGPRFQAFSAGTDVSDVRPLAIEAMREIGIDISGQRSKSLTEFVGERFEYAVTTCDEAREACPFFPGAVHQLHWSFDDPSAAIGSDAERLSVFRRVRAEIAARIEAELLPLA